MPAFVVVGGRYVLDAPCPKCGDTDRWYCYPGEWPRCRRCDVQVLTHGRTPEAACVTPTSRIDCHLKQVRVRDSGEVVCAFCGSK